MSTDLDSAARWTIATAAGEHPDQAALPIRLMNAYCVALASKDPSYLQLVEGPGINYPDGAPVAWTMRRTAHDSKQVRGPSFFLRTLEEGLASNVRHYFFGTTNETLALMRSRLEKAYPGLVIAGTSEAPFGSVDQILQADVIESITGADPDIVWVGLGTPKQDFVARRLADEIGVPCVGVGAAFDFAAGTQPEAHPLVRKMGLEWLHRLSTEPRRLWRRYLWGNSRFLAVVAREIVSSRSRHKR
ncbi:WecB/TagA/CpsF family glycosyltransferase [Nigerium massiliense]|uniref:WecB/TagA/CpsF family glycosyltransferase n=1 Tax=Nigerium massiliense TaxID=1522317 RepID=UPI0012FD368A|nr:WecB/TagA/CpsF family glycosyltransferase [Nigerium massiliense]